MASLLTIVQNACDEIGIERPATVIGNGDLDARRLLRLSNIEGRDLAEIADWTVLERLHTFTTTDTVEEYALPSDYDRLLRDTEWDRTNTWPLYGPLSPRDWEVLKSSSTGSGLVGRRYRIIRSATSTSRTIRIDPVPSVTGDTLAFRYQSKNWCSNAAGSVTQAAWAADDDVNLLDDRLMELGLVVRYKRAWGGDYASESDEHVRLLARRKGQDRPSPNLSLTPGSFDALLGPWSLPETGLGS